MFVLGLEADPEAAREACEWMDHHYLYPEAQQCFWMGWSSDLAPLLSNPFTRMLLLEAVCNDLQLSPSEVGGQATLPDSMIRDLAEGINKIVPDVGNKKNGRRNRYTSQAGKGFA
jgi:hypothetical protein